MHCYTHQDQVAICLCGTCLKGLCKTCAKPYKNYSVCSDTCQEEIVKREELNLRAQAIYRIGESKGLQSVPWLSLILILLGLAFLFWGGSEIYLEGISFTAALPALAGVLFFLAGISNWKRFKRTGIG